MKRLLCLRLPGFYVKAMETCLSEPAPLIVAREGTVLDASPEVFENGVAVGMPVRKATRISPAVVLEEDPSLVRPLYRQVWNVAASHTPIVETTDYHEGFLDLTGCLKRGKRLIERAERIRAEIHAATGLTPRIGGGSMRYSALLAAQRGPRGFVPKMRSEEHAFLRRVSIGELPFLSPRTAATLVQLGVRTLADVARQSIGQLEWLAPKGEGKRLSLLAYGRESDPLRPNYPPASVALSHAFAEPTDYEAALLRALTELCEKGNRQLAKDGLRPMEMAATLYLTSGERRHRENRFSREGISPLARSYRAERLFREMWRGEELDRIGLTLKDLEPISGEQGVLWGEGDRRSIEKASFAVEMTRARFGVKALSFAHEGLQASPSWAESVLLLGERIPRGAGWYG